VNFFVTQCSYATKAVILMSGDSCYISQHSFISLMTSSFVYK